MELVGHDGPRVLRVERAGPIIEGVVQSDSRPDKKLYGRVLLQCNFLCGCESSRLAGRACKHLKAVLMEFEKEELVEAIMASHRDPDAR